MSLTLRACQAAVLASLLALCVCSTALAQEQPVASSQLQTPGSSSTTQSTVIPPPPSIDDDPSWHFTSLSYLWFPGVHGTVGAKGYSTDVDVSPADVLKHFNIGLMGSFEPQYKRWSLPFDFVWVKLSDTKTAIQFPDYSAKATVKEGIFTQKVDYLVLNGKMVKVRATAGVRGWYASENLKLTPPEPPSFSVGSSQGWADVIGGANFLIPLSPKMSVMILGDAGAGGANLDYQVAGFANYQIKPKWGIGIGYRYLDVNYRNTNQNILDIHTSGIALTLLYKYGKQPPVQ
jgi:opacity protein-like surface antigen